MGMVKDLTPESNGKSLSTYSFSILIKDVLILLLAALPEAAQRTALLFTDKPLVPFLQERGWSMSVLLLGTVPLAIVLFYKTHRTKITEEAVFIFKQAPLFIFIFALAIILLIFRGCELANQKSDLAGELKLAINPPAYFSDTNQIRLSGKDFDTIVTGAKQFAKTFQKTNGASPKVVFILYSTSQHSRHLLRQMKDAVQQANWDYDTSKTPLQYPITSGIWIYSADPPHPSAQFNFWLNLLKRCSLEHYSSTWGTGSALTIGKQDIIIVINDPDYFE